MRSAARATVLLFALPLLLGGTGAALAGGFEIPDRGAKSVARGGANLVGVDDLTAIHYDPGALAKLRGTRFMLHNNVIFHDTTFARAPLGDSWGDDAGTTFQIARDRDKVFPLGPFIGGSSDFGLEDMTFALGIYGPSAVGAHDYEDYGPQSFMLTEMNILVAYLSFSAAWKMDDTFGVGVSLQWATVPKMEYELTINGTASQKPGQFQPVPEDAGTQLLTKLELSDWTGFTAIIGGWWRPTRWLELAVGGRVVPVYLNPKGTVATDKPTLVTDDLTAEMPLTLPPTAQIGARYIYEHDGREVFDLELDLFWEGWSVIDEYAIKMDGAISGQEVQDLIVEKAWKDTWSVRLGAGFQIASILELDLGGFWESGAVPKNYSHLDFPSFDRFGGGLGLSVDLDLIRVTAAYMHIFQLGRQVSEEYGKQFQQRPLHPCPDECEGYSGVVANAGKFESSYDIVSVGLDFSF